MIVVIYILSREPPVCAGESVAIAKRVHPFPSRTRSLSSSAPMILWGQPHGKIGRRRFTCSHGRPRRRLLAWSTVDRSTTIAGSTQYRTRYPPHPLRLLACYDSCHYCLAVIGSRQ